MKKSNKLLIAFGLTLILLPILAMAVFSRVYMVEGDNLHTDVNVKESFDDPSREMVAVSFPKQFSAIHIEGADRLALVVKLIKDDKYGIKIPEKARDLVTAVVDAQGVLQIIIKKPSNVEDDYRRIIIYAPSFKRLNIDNARSINLSAKLDSLEFNVTKSESAWIDGDALIKNLNANIVDVKGFGMENSNVVSATLKLKNTNLTTRSSNMDNLNISTEGNSEIEINGDDGDQPDKVIKNLTLNTTGKSKVKISDIQINNCSGSFSDSTAVEMPAVNIKQMFKLKK
ncbi:hypothetical protein ACVWYN_003583 [Pedobacter sp. UYP24]